MFEFLIKGILVLALGAALVAYRKGFFSGGRDGAGSFLAGLKQRRAQRRAGMTEKSVTVGREEIWYLDGGTGKTVVLLLHGFAGQKEDWTDFAALLIQKNLRIVAPDLPGFGRNAQDPNVKYSASRLTKSIRQFAREIALERFHVIGHSVGAMVAASYAYASKIEILSLALFEPLGLRVPYESELDKQIEQGRNPLITNSASSYESILKFMTYKYPELPPAILKQRGDRLAGKGAFYQQVWKDLREGDRANLLDLLLPELEVKTLTLVGDKSRVVHSTTPEVAERALRQAASRSATLIQCGHLPMVEQPEAAAKAYLDFLTGR